MNNKGQSIISEYVMIFFVVIAALVAMATFVQRGFEGRIHDARNFMVASAANTLFNECGTGCVNAINNNMTYEYEPYYMQTLSDQQQNAADTTGIIAATKTSGALYTKTLNEATQSISTSVQLPPGCANGGC